MEWFFPLFGILWLATIVVTIVALVDCIRVPDDAMFQNGTKLIWVLVIVFLTLIGAVLYFAIGRPRRGATSPARTVPPPPPPPV
jgi:uncharacterized RDD family membrane protein YckC